jgi:rare lipoprotein A (peptidoglycan hydrolase)
LTQIRPCLRLAGICVLALLFSAPISAQTAEQSASIERPQSNPSFALFGLDNAPPGVEFQLDPPPSPISTSTRGVASWYGRQFHGRRTASGERFNMYGLTAAHKTLPLMSYVRVRNPSNGKSIVVRVTDRGPFHGNRMIDLSYGAAQELDINGLGEVELDAVDRAEYEAQSDQTTIERDLREASFVPVPTRQTPRKPPPRKPIRR